MLPLPVTSWPYALTLGIAIAIWVGPEEARGWRWRGRNGGASVADRGSLYVTIGMIALGVLAALACALLLPGAAIIWNRETVFWVGIALMLIGVSLRSWAVRTLGRYFLPVVAVRADQQVVRDGPYRLIRHPTYSGALITLLGLGLTLTNWAVLVVLLGCALAGLAYRVRVEEQALLQALGQSYREYMAQTTRFVPFLF
ncbi:MAG TPA: isoprenylcysteine carboxylmethyltransferase family protein [Ktedonobacterales bacterium]|jgi:protein-S-isoprenylcysteine O-methyltransferase Ste14|nr:isoprenylcysteine carboxylmethyltransferase family protein [Ktedonobacterales bacterium]